MSAKPHAALLPNGLLDLLPPNAESEASVIMRFMKEFSAFGYLRVKPPLVEFEESLLSEGPGQKLARQTFRMMDPVSQRMMGVRADVTAQIARIASSRLADEPRPLRLSYAADVLRVNGSQLRPERQFCQVGCEMIGVDSVIADVEAPLVALKALSSVGLEKLSVDLTVPTLIAHLYDETNTDGETQEKLNDLIEKRDRDAIAALKGKAAEMIVSLMDHQPNDFNKVSLTKNAKADLDHIFAVSKELRAALDVYGLSHVQITIDPLERRGFEYQTGVSFTLFAIGARGEIGRGGRYDIVSQGHPPETAVGFTLYMDTILRVAPPPAVANTETVAAATDWKSVKSLQDKGIQVIRKS
jgi:ATP phosphoribosyltransferase regulatory subunit